MGEDADAREAPAEGGAPEGGPIEDYAGGEIRTYRGVVNGWLLVVYAVLSVWGLYYLVRFWGGLGPGLAR
jgi:hypothetical protein